MVGNKWTVGSLFSGIGGMDYGLELAGMRVKWQSEIEPYACRVLSKHWPDVVNVGDIRDVVWGDEHKVDVVCGGFPCQPFSQAGKKKGLLDERNLWPEMFRCIRELQPRYALMENVVGFIRPGLGGLLGDLAEIGYDAEWQCIRAGDVGAPHRRERVWIVAHPHYQRQPQPQGFEPKQWGWASYSGQSGRGESMAYANGERRYGSVSARMARGQGWLAPERCREVFGGRWGGTERWPAEPDVGRVAYGVPRRVDRIRGLGNAVVPQVVEAIGRAILRHGMSQEWG